MHMHKKSWRARLVAAVALTLALVSGAFAQTLMLGTTHTLRSSILGEDRVLAIALPPGYERDAQERYPVLVVLDAEWRFPFLAAAVETMADSGAIPKMIVIGVVNTQRERDLTPAFDSSGGYAPSGADNFLRFIKDELLPFADRRYRTRPYRILLGHSHAGFFTLYALMRDPDLFDAHVALSPSRGLDERHLKNLGDSLSAVARTRKFVYVASGGKESDDVLVGSYRFGKVLSDFADRGLDARFETFPFDTHGSVVHKSMTRALEYLAYWTVDFPRTPGTLLSPEQQRHRAVVERFGYDFRGAPLPRSIAAPLLALLDTRGRGALEAGWRHLYTHEREAFVFDAVELDNLAGHLRATRRAEDAQAVLELRRLAPDGRGAPRNNYTDEVDLARGLTAHYPLDGHALDRSGNGHHGALRGVTPAPDHHGRAGAALHFDGKGSRVEVRHSASLDLARSLTVAAWVKPAARLPFASWVAKSLDGVSQWRVGFAGDDAHWGLTQYTTDWNDFFVEGGAIPAGAWTHVAVCADQTLGRLTYYVNGRRVGISDRLIPFKAGQGPLLIGEQRDDGVFFEGDIDEVRLYDRVLGAQEVRALHELE